MSQEEVPTVAEPDGPLVNPWAVLGAGAAALILARGWSLVAPGRGVTAFALLLAGGLLAVGAALALHLPYALRTRDGRVSGAVMLLLAAMAAILTSLSVDPAWDSAQLLLRVAGVVALGGAALVFVPRLALAAVSLLVVLHFGGILTAVASVAPPGAPAPYLALQAWTRFYRPYLMMTHLTNGYHFYAPEPGPTTLLWFRVGYADGSARWVKVHDPADPTLASLTRRRMGALANTVGATAQFPPSPELAQRREVAGRLHNPPIPPAPMPANAQYREPIPAAKLLLESYARYVARTHPHPDDPAVPVTGVKVYRVDHYYPEPRQFRDGFDPLDPTLAQAFYQGDFDAEGRLKPECRSVTFDEEDRPVYKQDPFLYWLIPIVREPGADGKGERLIDYVRLHAGDKGEARQP